MYYYILKCLPVKIEFKNEGNNIDIEEKIAVGFIHDIIKNNYVVKVILEEFRSSQNSKTLSGKSIVNDTELIKFFVEKL